MTKRVLVPLARGFEEIEAVVVIDVLRRADVEVVVAGLEPGPIEGAHGITIQTDAELDDVLDETFDMLVLPGGIPGTTHLAADQRVLGLVKRMHGEQLTTAAICAAPTVLHAAGILGGVSVTAHPAVRAQLEQAEVCDEPRVVRSGSVVTSQGVGTALEFALELVLELSGGAKASELAKAMVVR